MTMNVYDIIINYKIISTYSNYSFNFVARQLIFMYDNNPKNDINFNTYHFLLFTQHKDKCNIASFFSWIFAQHTSIIFNILSTSSFLYFCSSAWPIPPHSCHSFSCLCDTHGHLPSISIHLLFISIFHFIQQRAITTTPPSHFSFVPLWRSSLSSIFFSILQACFSAFPISNYYFSLFTSIS